MGATGGIEREMRRLVVAAESLVRKLDGQSEPAGLMVPAEGGWRLARAAYDVDIPPIRLRPVVAWAYAGQRALPVVQWALRDTHLTVVQEGEPLAIVLIPPGVRVANHELERAWLDKKTSQKSSREDE